MTEPWPNGFEICVVLELPNRKKNNSRKDAKHAKFGKITRYFSLRLGALAPWREIFFCHGFVPHLKG
jgi:hypothetical protein